MGRSPLWAGLMTAALCLIACGGGNRGCEELRRADVGELGEHRPHMSRLSPPAPASLVIDLGRVFENAGPRFAARQAAINAPSARTYCQRPAVLAL